jgi:GAF domain-containing protein
VTTTGTAIEQEPSREHRLARTLVSLADSLVDDYDVVDLLDRLVVATAALFGVSAVSLMIDNQQGGLSVIAVSDEEARQLALLQTRENQGPCIDCIRGGTPVVIGNLREHMGVWPHFVTEAIVAGFQSTAVLPLRLRDQIIGGLAIFDARPDGLSANDQELAQAMADIATIAIIQRQLLHRSSQLTEQLQSALSSRIIIEQATGMLAERQSIPLDVAFQRMRRSARLTGRKLTDVAVAVTAGEDLPDPLSSAGGKP